MPCWTPRGTRPDERPTAPSGFIVSEANRIKLTAGIIDPSAFLNTSAYTNGEFTQFSNRAFVNACNLVLAAYEWGGAVVWVIGDWTFDVVGMAVTEHDHDFRHLVAGLLVPHGVYDDFYHRGFMTLGTSRQTSTFRLRRHRSGLDGNPPPRLPQATETVLTFDAGGANAGRSLRFKEDLIAVSRRLGPPLRVAHYSPYTSKWHPIEHRLFGQVERALRGAMLGSAQTALAAIERVSKQTGL